MKITVTVAFWLVLLMFSVVALADSEAAFTLPSGVKVKIVEAPFDRKLFKISQCAKDGHSCVINGFPVGLAFGWPKTYVKSITATYDGQSYSLDASNMYNAWGGRPLEHKGIIRYFGGKCFDAKNCVFRGIFGDGAETYVAEWAVVNGVQTRTVLTASDDVVRVFMRSIDPPEYQ